MRHIVYISNAASGLGEADTAAILEASQRNNQKRDISGFLLFNGRNFLQLIEGPQKALESLMSVLDGDPRHSGIIRLEDNSIPARDCEGWSMKRLMLSDSLDTRKASLEQLLPESLNDQVRRIVLNFAALN